MAAFIAYAKEILEGLRGTIEYEPKLYRSNIEGEKLEELETIDEATFDLSNFRDNTWELNLSMRDAARLDVWKDYVKLEMTVAAGGESITRDFGLYIFDVPSGFDSPMALHYTLTGQSPEILLMGGTAQFGYSVAAGTGVLAAVRNILINEEDATIPGGIPPGRLHLPPEDQDVALTRRFFADPFVNAEDTRWLRIVNQLLAAGGFYALYTTNEGRFATKKIPATDRLERDLTYGTEPETDRIITSDTIPFENDQENFANRVIVQSGDPTEAASIAYAENHDPNSPVSRENYGRWKQQDPVVLPNFVTAAEAQLLANAALRRASGLNSIRQFETNFDIRVRPRQTLGLEVYRDDGSAVVTDTEWPVVSVSASLDDSSVAKMNYEVHHGVRL
jgi:hypothetical protein